MERPKGGVGIDLEMKRIRLYESTEFPNNFGLLTSLFRCDFFFSMQGFSTLFYSGLFLWVLHFFRDHVAFGYCVWIKGLGTLGTYV